MRMSQSGRPNGTMAAATAAIPTTSQSRSESRPAPACRGAESAPGPLKLLRRRQPAESKHHRVRRQTAGPSRVRFGSFASRCSFLLPFDPAVELRSGLHDHGKSARPGNLLSINQEVDPNTVDESKAVDLVLGAGEISIHHGHLIHGSNPNCSNRRRCGMTIRYVPPYVKPVRENSLGTPWPAVLARGEDRERNFGEWELQFQT